MTSYSFSLINNIFCCFLQISAFRLRICGVLVQVAAIERIPYKNKHVDRNLWLAVLLSEMLLQKMNHNFLTNQDWEFSSIKMFTGVEWVSVVNLVYLWFLGLYHLFVIFRAGFLHLSNLALDKTQKGLWKFELCCTNQYSSHSWYVL